MNWDQITGTAEVTGLLLTVILTLLGFERRLGKFVTRDELRVFMHEQTQEFKTTMTDLKTDVKENKEAAEERHEKVLNAIDNLRPPWQHRRNSDRETEG